MEAIQKNAIHEATIQFWRRGACRHERVWQPQRICRYQHLRWQWRGGDFTIAVDYAAVDTGLTNPFSAN